MPHRILSISGLRGIIGDGLDPEYVVEFASALGTMAEGKPVVVGRDGRGSGKMLQHAVFAGLMSAGCKVFDAGIASTPTCGVLVKHLDAAAGLQITASHNPVEWNGLKPFSAEGSVLNQAQGEHLLSILVGKGFRQAKWNELGAVETIADAGAPHLERILSLVDVEGIRRRNFKVVLDCNHGSGSVLALPLLDQLGCSVHPMGAMPDGKFEHAPEPLAENLTGLCRIVKEQGADVGFAQDPDADRLAIVDNQGRYIGEELTLGLCADHVLSHRPGPLVVNGSTSRVTADVASKHNCPFFRSYVGEAHVVTRMKEVAATLGGEGNGGVIEPRVGYVRDSFVSMAYILDGLAASNRSVADWADSLPQYTIVKLKLHCERDQVPAACNALQRKYSDARAQAGDGLRLDWDNRWVQVRGSNTEPMIRVIAEAPDPAEATTLCEEALAVVRQAVKPAG